MTARTIEYLPAYRRQTHARERDARLTTTMTRRDLPAAYTTLPSAERLSDAGDAALVEALDGDTLRHVSEWGWLAYHEGRWDEHDGQKLCERQIEAALHQLAMAAAEVAETVAGKALYKHVQDAFNRVGSIARAAGRREKLSARPEQFDAKPQFLNATDGVVDLTTGERYDPHPNFFLTKQAAARYSKETAKDVQAAAQGDGAAVARLEAQCPRWLDFLRTVFVLEDGRSDGDLIAYMQKALGYTLTTSTQEHALFVLYGGGKNGKSTLLNTLAGVIGDYATTVKPEVLVNHGMAFRSESGADPELSRLPGVRLVTSTEPSGTEGKNKGKLDTSRVKLLTGGDPLSVRKLYHESFTFTPSFKLFLATNELPTVEKDDEGTWRRLKPIPFRARFTPGENAIPDLHLTLLKERDGVLAWLVLGALRFYAEGGLGDPPQSVANLLSSYRREQQPYSAFFEDVVTHEMGAVTPLQDAYDAFLAWCRQHQEELDDTIERPRTRDGWQPPLILPSKSAFKTMCEGQNYATIRRTKGYVLLTLRLRAPGECAHGSPDAAGCSECSKTAVFGKVPLGRSIEDFPENALFATSSTSSLHAETPPAPVAAPKVVPVCTTDCPHLNVWVADAQCPVPTGMAVCRDCGATWERLEDVPPVCDHHDLDHGRCTRCGWQKERPREGGCRHPVAAPSSPVDPHHFYCPHCAEVTDWKRNGLSGGYFICKDPESHRADWDGLGCPHCWIQPQAPWSRAIDHGPIPQGVELPQVAPDGLRPDIGWTFADAYRLLPTCTNPHHERLEVHTGTTCEHTGLLVREPDGLPMGEVRWVRDEHEVVLGAESKRLPLMDEAVAALALAHGLAITPALADKLLALRACAERERARLACPHNGGWDRTEGRGKRALILCKVCGADMSRDGGYV